MAQTFKDAFGCYEAIGQWLMKGAPEPWESITVEFEILEMNDVSEQVIYYSPQKNPRKEKQFFIEDTRFADCFYQLARLTSTPDKGLFKKCYFTLHADGRYDTRFEY